MIDEKSEVSFASSAIADLLAVQEWYESQGVPGIGRRIVEEVMANIQQVARFPEMGRVVPEFESPTLRELILPPYRLVYLVTTNHVRIVRLWRSERLMTKF